MRITRRSILKVAGAVPLVAIARPSMAQPIVLKWGDSRPPSHPGNVFAAEAAKAIVEESGGRIEIQHYPASQLGGDPDMLSQLRSGALELYTTTAPFLMSLSPSIGISGVGFALPDYETVWRAMDGDLGATMRGAAEAVGIHVFETVWDNGYRQISSNRPILAPADLSGFKMRVAGVPLFFSMFESLGAAPVTLNFGEVYVALQTGLVDGQENPLVLFHSAKFNEVQKHVSMSNHVWDGLIVTANRQRFSGLDRADRELISKHINAAGLRQREKVKQSNIELEKIISDGGVQVHQVDSTKFVEALKSTKYYSTWKETMGSSAWTALEKYAGKLT